MKMMPTTIAQTIERFQSHEQTTTIISETDSGRVTTMRLSARHESMPSQNVLEFVRSAKPHKNKGRDEPFAARPMLVATLAVSQERVEAFWIGAANPPCWVTT